MFATSFLLVTSAYIISVWTASPAAAAAEYCSSNMKTGHARAVKAENGSSLCAVDPPSDILTSVRSLLDCQRICSSSTGCWNFNYFRDTKRCELFYFLPASFISGIPQCKHYQYEADIDDCVLSQFTQLPGTTSLHAVIFERHNWEDARLRCRLLHPKAHLVVIDDEAENTAIKNHLLTFSSLQYLQCLEPGWAYYGYWTAGQRLYAPDCSTGFVWKPDNQTVASISTDSWVTASGWMPGQPDCAFIYAAPNNYENCMNLPVDWAYRWDDITCNQPQCPLCEIEV